MPWMECQLLDERLRTRCADMRCPTISTVHAVVDPQAAAVLLPEMTPCEGAARPGLEVALKRDGAAFIRELHNDVETPGPQGRRVRATTVVVRSKTCRHVRGQSGVVARRTFFVLQHVDESLERHATGSATAVPTSVRSDLTRSVSPALRDHHSAHRIRGPGTQKRPAAGFVAKPTFARFASYGGHPSPVFGSLIRAPPFAGIPSEGWLAIRSSPKASEGWRRRPDLNRGWRFCRPLPYHLATAPR